MCTSCWWIQNECAIHSASCRRTSRLRVTAQVSRGLFVRARRPSSRPSRGWKPRREPTGFQPTCMLHRPDSSSSFQTTTTSSSEVGCLLFKQANESEESVLLAAWKRFGPNNFVLHFFAAHGVFPLASRLFNHSCYPTAWQAFVVRNKGLCMEVRALVKIPQSEEVCFAIGADV
jgi:hypothetical protein